MEIRKLKVSLRKFGECYVCFLINSPGLRPNGVSDLRRTESAASRSKEEARGIVYRAVEAKDSKWLGVKS